MGVATVLRMVPAGLGTQWESGARARMLMAATLATTGRERAVTVREMSATQAILTGSDLPAAGADVILRCRSIEAFATVSWSDGARCGLEFDEPVDVVRIAMSTGPADARRAAAPVQSQRPAVRRSIVSDADMATALAWSNVGPVERLRRACPVRH